MTYTPPTPPLSGRFLVQQRRLARTLGFVGYGLMTGPMALVLVLRLLGAYGGLVRSLMSAIGPASMMFVGPAVLTLGWVLARRSTRPAHLSLSEAELRLHEGGSTRLVPRSDVVGGARRAAPSVGFELHLRNGDALVCDALHAPDRAVAQILESLGVDVSGRAATLRATAAVTPAFRAAWLFAAAFGVLMIVAHGVSSVPRLAAACVLAGVAWFVAAASLGPRVTVGVDGLRVERLGHRRFIPWSRVDNASLGNGALFLTLVDGEFLRLGSVNAAAWTLLARIGEAKDASTASEARRAVPTGREGRPVEQWRDAMSALVVSTGYREVAVTTDDLEGVLQGVGARGDERVGAALALAAVDRERHATGIRVAAASVADEPVREALDEIADGYPRERTLARAAR